MHISKRLIVSVILASAILFFLAACSQKPVGEATKAYSIGSAIPCIDNDDGKNFTVKSYVRKGFSKNEDVCVDSTVVREYYCDNNAIKSVKYDCAKGGGDACYDGACVMLNLPSNPVNPLPVNPVQAFNPVNCGKNAWCVKLTYGKEVADKDSEIDYRDLKRILANGMVNDTMGVNKGRHPYAQKLSFVSTSGDNAGAERGTARFVHTVNDDGNKEAADYLEFDDGATDYAFVYSLSFSTPISFADKADLANNTLMILGKKYLISDAFINDKSLASLILQDSKNKIGLDHDKEASLWGKNVEGTRIMLNSSNGVWYGLIYSYIPNDQEYIAQNPKTPGIIDPVFGSFDIGLNAVDSDYSSFNKLQFSANSTTAWLSGSGKPSDIPYYIFVWNNGTFNVTHSRTISSLNGQNLRVSENSSSLIFTEEAPYGLSIKIGYSYDMVSKAVKLQSSLINKIVTSGQYSYDSGSQWNQSNIRESAAQPGIRHSMTEWGTLVREIPAENTIYIIPTTRQVTGQAYVRELI
ncbi:MAG TPA: hypothetical protein VJI75_03405 [Candidatus Nanoarchaeia archaeon]|nr:hypothetical protein [Candidatus Nanoarchaeia archaeon]